jgi:Tannase and feruloyl esterase
METMAETKGRALRRILLVSAAAGISVFFSSSCWAASCQELADLKLPDTEIKSAELVAAGAFIAPDKVKHPGLPVFCRVVASVKAAPDSDIGVEVWLPEDQWKGVFHGNGNGGYGGSLRSGYAGMEAGLLRGYASATTDMGTAPATALNGDPLIGHPQKWKDWGLLSTHVMTVAGKAIAKAFYGQDARHSYYTGCSTGGQQGLIEAQYYPDDYDGILVGAPVINRTWGHAAVLWDYLAANLRPGHKLTDTKLALLNNAVVSACGGKGNGLSTDPFVSDPLACKFNPATLTCRGADSDTCLTHAEVQTAKSFYSGPENRAGHATYYGWLPGSEVPGLFGWRFLETPPNGEPAFDGLFKWVFGADWDWRKFDFDRDMPEVDARLGPVLNEATDGDISRFRARGGKLVIYQGWADTLVAPGQTLAFYNGLGREIGGTAKVRNFARLFMAPGVMHCGGGPGPSAFNSANGGARKPPSNTPRYDMFAAMTHWVEDGVAPAEVIATKYVDNTPAKGIAMQRPLCAYPQRGWYRGAGDTNDARNFVCSVKKPTVK